MIVQRLMRLLLVGSVVMSALASHAPASARNAAAHSRYTLVDLGTLGGPTSTISGPAVQILTDSGIIGGIADTLTPDGDSQIVNPTFGDSDPFI